MNKWSCIAALALNLSCYAHHEHVYVEERYHHPHRVIVHERVYEQQPVVVLNTAVPAYTTPVYVQSAPPADIAEEVTVSPGPDYVWIKGNWRWNGSWAWERGRWDRRPYNGAVWETGYWDHHPHGHVWVHGRWR